MIYQFDAEGPVHVVQISDCHLSGDRQQLISGVNPYLTLTQVIEKIFNDGEPVDLLLLTGDLTHDGEAEAYSLLQELLDPLTIPYFWLPGNHDLSGNMHSAARNPRLATKQILLPNWQILLLDSHVDNEINGLISQSELSWLATALKEHSDKYQAIFVHHHMLPVGCAWIDPQRIINAEQLLLLFDRSPRLRIVCNGHVHQEWQQSRGHYTIMTTPSTCVQFKQASDDFAYDDLPPGYRRFTLRPDGSYHTEVCRAN